MKHAFGGIDLKKDPDFNGSIWDKMELYSDLLCPICEAHVTKTGICLNACHLSPASRDRFNKLVVSAAESSRAKENTDAQ